MICGISSSGQSSQKTSRVSENLTRLLLLPLELVCELVFSRLFSGLQISTDSLAGDGCGDSPSGMAALAASLLSAAVPVMAIRLASGAGVVDADGCCSGIWNEEA